MRVNFIKKFKKTDNQNDYSDEEFLITQSQRGDDYAFERLIDIYEKYLYKMAFLYVKNEYDASDIYQETVLKAYMNISKLKNHKAFKTWITKILINNVYSSNKYFTKFEGSNEENFIGDFSYLYIEEKLDLYDAIDILDEKYRTAIILQYFYDLTIQQISEITNTNENTVKTNIRRAKKKMYDFLKEDKHV
ncbi:sigma-70 family RNA polymerase sigma factor [Paraclostridium bifermentans]|uniref:sigma-70 family RNA polymerase sigma factor n=1 Tax=Paraclostridium bifermentans TaxID=1490 RepID=UPI00387B0B30